MGWGPSYDGVTVKNNFVEIKGKRSFDARSNTMIMWTLIQKWQNISILTFCVFSKSSLGRGSSQKFEIGPNKVGLRLNLASTDGSNGKSTTKIVTLNSQLMICLRLNFMWLLMVAPSDDIERKLVAQIPKCFQNLQNKVSHILLKKG